MDTIAQVGIGIFGCSAIWLVGRKESWRKWGYLLGLCGQPFWIYTTVTHQQWGILALSVWYAYSWAQGVWNYIIKTDEQQKVDCKLDAALQKIAIDIKAGVRWLYPPSWRITRSVITKALASIAELRGGKTLCGKEGHNWGEWKHGDARVIMGATFTPLSRQCRRDNC